MAETFRFGRRVALPSTRQIKHDLLLMAGADKIEALKAELKIEVAKEAGGPTVGADILKI